MKKAWRIIQNSHLLLSKVYKANFPQQNTHRLSNRRISWGRRGILNAELLLHRHGAWKVGNGQQLGVLTHNWLSEHTPIFRDNTPLAAARQLRVANLLLPDHRGWDARKINSLFESSTAKLIKCIELLASHLVSDFQYGPYTKSGGYTTKSGYNMLLRQQNDICSMTSPIDVPFFRTVWILNIMPKWKFFLWKLWHNGIVTKVNLHLRGISTSGECPICLHDQEDTNHLFHFCPLAIEAWDQGLISVNTSTLFHTSFKDWLAYWVARLHKADQHSVLSLPTFIGILWAIWKLERPNISASKTKTSPHCSGNTRQYAPTRYFHH